MDEKAQKGIQHALKFLDELEAVYAEWNATWDDHKNPNREMLLQLLEGRIESKQRTAPAELHNLLYALGAVERPMAQ